MKLDAISTRIAVLVTIFAVTELGIDVDQKEFRLLGRKCSRCPTEDSSSATPPP
jgi:hypothetical protein